MSVGADRTLASIVAGARPGTRRGTAGYDQVRAFVRSSSTLPDPKPSYVADWDGLPSWRQETDADAFEYIEDEFRAAGRVSR